MPKYTAKFKADCVALLAGSAYPENPFKLEEVARHVGVPSRTLRRWFNGEVGSPEPAIVIQEKKALSDVFEDIAYKYLAHAAKDDVIDQVTGNAAVITAATAVDKMQLLRGLPTEIIGLLPDLLAALKVLGQDPSDVFNRIIQRAAEQKQLSG